ncbi:MAG: hypothetical protein HFH26_03985 [Clostridiaceae bacterium]|nr:hypothetical protein [Clostridiaceae bacterium]
METEKYLSAGRLNILACGLQTGVALIDVLHEVFEFNSPGKYADALYVALEYLHGASDELLEFAGAFEQSQKAVQNGH